MSTTSATIVNPPDLPYVTRPVMADHNLHVGPDRDGGLVMTARNGDASQWHVTPVSAADRLDLAAAIVGELGTVIAHPEGLPPARFDHETQTWGGYSTLRGGRFHITRSDSTDEEILGRITADLAVLRARHATRWVPGLSGAGPDPYAYAKSMMTPARPVMADHDESEG